MNRASLLHILDHATGISEAEVRELEQLATAFPYCQTAHLLLAKAAHDRGSMLAGQRLRRAATYAADRELLRQLIELTPAASASEPAATDTFAPASEAAVPPVMELAATAELLPPPVTAAPEPASDADVLPDAAVAQPVAAPTESEPLANDEHPHLPTEESVTELPAGLAPAAEEPSITEPVGEVAEEAEIVEAAPQTEAVSLAESERLDSTGTEDAPEAADATPAESPTTEVTDEELVATAASADSVIPVDVSPLPALILPVPAPDSALVNDELPPAAPPIRPPVEAGSSRFEFGLGDAPEPGPLYQLPELPEEPTAATAPAFRADELLAYALSAGSRFGAALTLRDAELTQDLPGTPSWHPDAVVLAHAAAHRPAAPAAPSSLALIDKFLRSQPRIKSAARPAPTDAPQADLSVRSTSAAPSLASESLAKIMVKQGKTARAIEIYEQLMQRQPEKKAYFAAQIDLLNQQTE